MTVEYKDLPRRTDSGKILLDKAFQTASNSKYDEHQRGLNQWLTKFWTKNERYYHSHRNRNCFSESTSSQ